MSPLYVPSTPPIDPFLGRDTGTKPLLHFVHANGVPSGTYRVLFDALAPDFDIIGIPLLGIDPTFPVNNHWQNLADHIIESIHRQPRSRPVIGLGHSMGALCSLLAAYKEPALMTQLIMLDPPLINGAYSLVMHLSKRYHVPTLDRLSPAGASAKRRDHWASREEAAEKLRTRGMFKTFHPQAFDDYIEYGLTDDPRRGGVTLTIPKDVEVEVFRTNPSFWWRPNQAKVPIPVQNLTTRDSVFYQRGFVQRAERQLGIPYRLVPQGSHMFPLEFPEMTARQIKAMTGLFNTP